MEKITDELYQTFSKKMNEKMADVGIKPSTLHILIKYVIEEIETMPVKGVFQKQLALRLINDLINNMADDNPDKQILRSLYESESISHTIELVVSASKGQININHVESCVCSCIKAYFK
jgi:hypothetical protein